MRLLQINTTLNTTSTGRIMEEIGVYAMDHGFESIAAFSHLGSSGSALRPIKIGNKLDQYLHGIKTRLFDRHGFGSAKATRELVKQIDEIAPDIIGLHNLHGYYLNVEILFTYFKKIQKPVVWTFHDCWPFTGHCVYFDRIGCEKWRTECRRCPQKTKYPASYGLDNSKVNYHQKKELFSGLKNLTIVTPSRWLKDLVEQSFLRNYPVKVIHNGIDLKTFRPDTENLPAEIKNIEKKIVLGVASVWDQRKGLQEFVKLSRLLDEDYQVVLVGLTQKQMDDLPNEIIGIARTENIQQLASLYSAAEVFVNPTLSDNFPTTNLESLACGTPVITYNTGGSPEAVDGKTGIVVPRGDIRKLKVATEGLEDNKQTIGEEDCRLRAEKMFNKDDRYRDYLNLYNEMISRT